MHVETVTKIWTPKFKQVHEKCVCKGKTIHIITDYLNGEATFKTIDVLSQDRFYCVHKEPVLGKWKTVFEHVLDRKRK